MLQCTVKLWPRPIQLVTLRQITMASVFSGCPPSSRPLPLRSSRNLNLVDRGLQSFWKRAYSAKPKFRYITPCAPAGDASVQQRPTVQQLVKRISRDDVEVNFARSGGAGGQNVNKVNTKVDMRLKLDVAWLSEEMRGVLLRQEKKRINKDGELVITSTLTRSQVQNIEDALTKLQECLDKAAESLIPPEVDPEKVKQMAKQKKIANENRLLEKKAQAQKKGDRRAKIEW